MSQSEKVRTTASKSIPRSTTINDFGIFENMMARTTLREDVDQFSHILPDRDDYREQIAEKMSQSTSHKSNASSLSNQSSISRERSNDSRDSYLPPISPISTPKNNSWSDSKLSKLMKRL